MLRATVLAREERIARPARSDDGWKATAAARGREPPRRWRRRTAHAHRHRPGPVAGRRPCAERLRRRRGCARRRSGLVGEITAVTPAACGDVLGTVLVEAQPGVQGTAAVSFTVTADTVIGLDYVSLDEPRDRRIRLRRTPRRGRSERVEQWTDRRELPRPGRSGLPAVPRLRLLMAPARRRLIGAVHVPRTARRRRRRR